MKKQSGFASIELVLLVVIVAAIAGVGYYVVNNRNTGQTSASFISSTSTPNTSVATLPMPQINTTSDLSNALNVLNQTNVGANSIDSSQLTTQSSGL